MNKKLENLFNLPDQEQAEETVQLPTTEETQAEITTLRTTLDMSKRIDNALTEVEDMEQVNADLDKLANKAEEAFDQLMNLGSNMDDRNSGKIFEVAATMLKNAVDAKTAKLDKKLRIVELQLRKERLDRDSGTAASNAPTIDAVITADRSTLLKDLIKNLDSKS